MPRFDESYPGMIAALEQAYGPIDRPEEHPSPFEAMIGVAVSELGREDRRAQVLEGLSRASLLDPGVIASSSTAELRDALRENGIDLPIKLIAVVQRLAHWFSIQPEGFDTATHEGGRSTLALLEELAAINGIGRTFASTILLHAFHRGVYPVDRATYRILLRHGWIDLTADADEVASLILHETRDDPDRIRDLRQWFQRIGRQYCRPASPKCQACPMRHLLPDAGPVEFDG